VQYLPTIVESAVASPAAAQAACNQIRKYLSKENYSRPNAQYNAVMLIRILADNPGESFTKHMDKQFADTIKYLLRNGHDPSVAQMLRESLDALDREKSYDTNLIPLFAMWKKEKGLMANAAKQFGPRTLHAPAWNGAQQQTGYHSGGRSHSSSRTLPPPTELAGRIEEARTSAKLLLQLVQSTPANELLANDLVKEFSERCMSAQRSIQGYINCDNPPPDDDTMLTLIETNEQLSLAASKHQRAVLQARRLQGSSPSPPVSTVNSNSNSNNYPAPGVAPASTYTPPPQPPPRNAPGVAAASTYTPPPQPPLRNDVPVLPPIDVTSSRETPPSTSNVSDTTGKSDLPLPPVLQAGGNRHSQTNPVSDDDDPFADHHSSGFVAPGVRRPEGEGQADGYSQSTGSSTLQNPGVQSTASYLGRQESSVNNLTMRGATQSPLSEAGEYNGRPRTPENTGNRRDSDVSPIVERTPVTYRF
jgi:hypothetical protein